MQNVLDKLDVDRVVKCAFQLYSVLMNQSELSHISDILSLQQPSGVFAGDAFGEIDTRFLYCAINALSLLGKLHELDRPLDEKGTETRREKAVGYIQRCRNYDGGFGSVAGAESHSAQGKDAACSILHR